MPDNIDVTPGTGKTIAADDIGGVLSQRVKVQIGADGSATDVSSANPMPVSSTSLPLPSGAATSALQGTGNTSLSSIDTKLTDNATQTTLATRLSESDFDTKSGSLTETAPATDTASSGLNGRLQRLAQRLTSLIALLPTSLGQKTKANSLAVTLASDQDPLPITDSGGSLTVDGSVTANAGTNLNTSALALDSTLTGGTQKSKITDGTNEANILKSDGTASGQNSIMIGGGYLSVAYTTTTVQAVATTDVANYNYVSVHQTNSGGSSVTNFQGSNDNTNWIAIALAKPSNTLTSPATSTSSPADIFTGPLQYRYFRLNVTGIASGTTAGTVIFFTNRPTSLVTVAGQLALNGTTSIAGVKTNNNAAPGATNVGALPALANAAQPSWTEGNQVTESVDLKGNHRIRISDAAGNDRGANVTAANALVVDASATTQPISGAVTVSGTVTVDDLAAAPTGAAVPANAQYQGNLAQTALPSAATAGNLTGNLSDKFGRSVIVPGTIRDLVGTQTTTITTSTSETTIVTAAASVFNDLSAIWVANTSPTAVRADLRDTTGGSVLASFYIPAGDMRGATFNRPLPQTSVNTNWTLQSSASVTDLRVYTVFDKNK